MNVIAIRKTIGVFEIGQIAVLLSISIAMPFMIHLLPDIADRPLGAYLLPMFYAPLLAVILYRAHVGIVVGLLSPLLNHMITGHPVEGKVAILTAEVLIFTIIALIIHNRWKRSFLIGPGAYLLTLCCLMELKNAVISVPGMIILSAMYFVAGHIAGGIKR